MDLNLKNHVAIITGGASGIGRATAEAFAAEGAHVAIWDRSESGAAAQISEAHGVRAIAVATDVADEASVAWALQQTVSELGPVDHLVHAAAITGQTINVDGGFVMHW